MADRKKSFFHFGLWQLIYIVLQCTWGLLQSTLGFILFLIHFRCPHDRFHGSIRTKWPTLNGISLGLFIFTPNDTDSRLLRRYNGNQPRLTDQCERMSVHEYGHTYQSLILGPLYLFTVGITSLGWSRLNRYKQLRKEYGVPYSSLWTERWANDLGEKILGQPSIRH